MATKKNENHNQTSTSDFNIFTIMDIDFQVQKVKYGMLEVFQQLIINYRYSSFY